MLLRPVQFFCLALLLAPMAYLFYTASSTSAMTINAWNGHKSTARQAYERAVLVAAMEATRAEYGDWKINESLRDLPAPEDEAGVFRLHRFDVFGTVAGNQTMAAEQKHIIPIPLMKGLLGYRVLMVRAEDQPRFAAIKTVADLQQFTLGIPANWADAELFRHNHYPVDERGDVDELFKRQLNREFDYAVFGVSEIEHIVAGRAQDTQVNALAIEQSLLLYYPLPVVFYVNPTKTLLAQRLTDGLQRLIKNGELDQLFSEHYGDVSARLRLHERTLFTLQNPDLPHPFLHFQSTLLRCNTMPCAAPQ